MLLPLHSLVSCAGNDATLEDDGCRQRLPNAYGWVFGDSRFVPKDQPVSKFLAYPGFKCYWPHSPPTTNSQSHAPLCAEHHIDSRTHVPVCMAHSMCGHMCLQHTPHHAILTHVHMCPPPLILGTCDRISDTLTHIYAGIFFSARFINFGTNSSSPRGHQLADSLILPLPSWRSLFAS